MTIVMKVLGNKLEQERINWCLNNRKDFCTNSVNIHHNF